MSVSSVFLPAFCPCARTDLRQLSRRLWCGPLARWPQVWTIIKTAKVRAMVVLPGERAAAEQACFDHLRIPNRSLTVCSLDHRSVAPLGDFAWGRIVREGRQAGDAGLFH